MRILRSRRDIRGLTLVELLFAIGVITLFAMMLLPASRRDRAIRAPIHACLNNLKQIGLGMETWAFDHSNQFPAQVLAAGPTELSGGGPARYFRVISGDLYGPRVFCCPADTAKVAATNFTSGFSDKNVSYFMSLNATPTTPNTILAGDRNLQVQGRAVKPGIFLLTSNLTTGWTREMHKSAGVPCGNMAFVDGHVELLKKSLSAVIERQELSTNKLVFP